MIPRIGHGYDVHRLVEGRALIIGGEKIEYPLGLDGHSDADVLLHAVMDACWVRLLCGTSATIFRILTLLIKAQIPEPFCVRWAKSWTKPATV